MSHFPETGSTDVAQQLQQTVHGLVEEFFQMLGDGEARFVFDLKCFWEHHPKMKSNVLSCRLN